MKREIMKREKDRRKERKRKREIGKLIEKAVKNIKIDWSGLGQSSK